MEDMAGLSRPTLKAELWSSKLRSVNVELPAPESRFSGLGVQSGNGECEVLHHELLEQQPPRGRVLEQRQDEFAVMIDPRSPANDWHHAVGARQLEKRLDVVVREPMCQQAKRQLSTQL